jgi:mono/diheme cytochrome c family protein
MHPLSKRRGEAALCLGVALVALAFPRSATADEAQLRRGELLFAVGDCVACHTDQKGGGAPLAVGRALDTPFGRFYAPNISADKQNGIGAWSEVEFRRALREGIGRDGERLFPVFPFASYSGMTDADIADLYAYLQSRPAVATPSKPHELHFPFSWRFLLVFWRWLFFSPGPLQPVASQSAEWSRGRYLAEAVAHCQECHTPRSFIGGLKTSQAFSGNPEGPDNLHVPNITPDPDTGIGKWSVDDIATLLHSGQTPDGDFVGSGMGEVVKGTAALSDDDRRAIAVYIKSQKPIHTEKKAQGVAAR